MLIGACIRSERRVVHQRRSLCHIRRLCAQSRTISTLRWRTTYQMRNQTSPHLLAAAVAAVAAPAATVPRRATAAPIPTRRLGREFRRGGTSRMGHAVGRSRGLYRGTHLAMKALPSTSDGELLVRSCMCVLYLFISPDETRIFYNDDAKVYGRSQNVSVAPNGMSFG